MSGRKPTFLLSGNSARGNTLFEPEAMALALEQVRKAADRVAGSQGLDIVEIEYLGGGKHRILRIFIEKNREERAKRARESSASTAAPASVEGTVELGGQSSMHASRLRSDSPALDQLAWVTHEDCERFSRDFGALLDVEDLVSGSEYTLEVSSPGLDRKLTSRGEYERFRESLIKVQTFAPVAGSRHWRGRLVDVTKEGIVLETAVGKQKRGKNAAKTLEPPLRIAFADIEKANLAPEF